MAERCHLTQKPSRRLKLEERWMTVAIILLLWTQITLSSRVLDGNSKRSQKAMLRIPEDFQTKTLPSLPENCGCEFSNEPYYCAGDFRECSSHYKTFEPNVCDVEEVFCVSNDCSSIEVKDCLRELYDRNLEFAVLCEDEAADDFTPAENLLLSKGRKQQIGGTASDDNIGGEFCRSHKDCTDREYCDEFNTCYGCSICLDINDGIDGTCGPFCGEFGQEENVDPQDNHHQENLNCYQHSDCQDGNYCDERNTCFDCADCLCFEDSIDGKCPNCDHEVQCQHCLRHDDCGIDQYCNIGNQCSECRVCSCDGNPIDDVCPKYRCGSDVLTEKCCNQLPTLYVEYETCPRGSANCDVFDKFSEKREGWTTNFRCAVPQICIPNACSDFDIRILSSALNYDVECHPESKNGIQKTQVLELLNGVLMIWLTIQLF